MKTIAIFLVLVGVGLAARAWVAAREYGSYTVIGQGFVSQRTPTFCAIRIEGEQPGGQSSVELPYRAISGTQSDTPPAGGPAYNLGDPVLLVHPPGQLSRARLNESLVPAVPLWQRWAGLGLIAVGILLFRVAAKRGSHGEKIAALSADAGGHS